MKQTRQHKEQNAEKLIRELFVKDNLKKITPDAANELMHFYNTKSFNRLQTARAIYKLSQESALKPQLVVTTEYTDYGEAVSAAYYAMYYIVHAYLADAYKTKLEDGIRGVHAITHNIVVYYLVKTKKLARHLYEEYLITLETTSAIQNLTVESFMEDAYHYAEKYDRTREAREVFTYRTTGRVEAQHAERAVKTAEEFIGTISQLFSD